ncbi:hypothetical protein [Lachnoclostridium sp. MSJ-17]|uniref:hypothetical protein n=1 Tax=Lachnoclostridium sp. MSJ-17 TaxID=2841516 RepID=UPI001C1067B3|nr:hypothetical protein [Lachnoclostridium sp. MSJ-17]MBU5461877.1 hypothetical protein [Lachnoclostridium sp. MSJ-17]
MSDINKDAEKQEQLLKELEIENILAETHEMADREKMKRTAQKYRVKPKIADIFSNADMKPRLTNANPLELDKEENNNTIVGDKNAATIQAELIMDGADEKVQTPEEAEREAIENAERETEEEAPQETGKIVTLTPEYAEDTKFSGEVLSTADTFKEAPVIENITSIDIEVPEEKNVQQEQPAEPSEPEKPEPETPEKPEKPLERVVAKVPIYRPEDPKDMLNIKAGRFSEVVTTEYEEYIRSKNPSVITHVIRPEPKPDIEEDEKEEDDRSAKEKILSAVVGFFSKDESDDDDIPHEKAKTIEDYTGEDDEKSILYELNHNIRKLFSRTLIMGIVTLLSIVMTFVTRIFPDAIISAVPVAPAAYAVFNFLLVGFSVFVNRVAVMSGLTPLLRFKGNSDTAVAVAAVAAVLQTIVSFFTLGDMTVFSVNYYCVVVLLALFTNNLGKLIMVLRVKDNFRFVSSKGQKYAAKIYNNEYVAGKMLSGTAADRALIAYQHQTGFPANFLKISYAPDPSEDLASKLAPITSVVALVIALLYGVVKLSFGGAINTLALISALAIPVSTLLAVNFPVRRLCKNLLGYGAMLAGYPSIKQFCDSTAIMLDANELFPTDCIELEGIKTYEDYNVDESLLCGIAVLKEAQNPLANAFDSVISETGEQLPEVESVLYEDELGLVGWINGERVLVGSRNLMDKYSVETPTPEYEERYTSKGRQITYISRAGRLVAMVVTIYHADQELQAELQRAEANGISFLIRTTDYNITDDLVAKLYGLFYRSIKVLPTGLGHVLKEAQTSTEETSRSYLITGGKAASLARAISGSVKIKSNISLAIMIQLIAIVLGILIASVLSLYANIGVMGSLEVLIYTLFWAVAAIAAPAIQKP